MVRPSAQSPSQVRFGLCTRDQQKLLGQAAVWPGVPGCCLRQGRANELVLCWRPER